MTLRIGCKAPNFTAVTTEGVIDFHRWIGDGWGVLFSHPKDFTPVCTTELGYVASLKREFDRRGCKVIGLSVDRLEDHEQWSREIEEVTGHAIEYPLIADPELKVAKAYDMLPGDTNLYGELGLVLGGDTSDSRREADNATVRSVFVIGPDKRIKAMLTYPASTGRNFDEVLRVLDSCQLTARHNVATPANWRPGDDVVVPASVPDAVARARFPAGWRSPKPYLRFVPQPR
jgi:alkyl hydroperoxide reductase subunit AhpC